MLSSPDTGSMTDGRTEQMSQTAAGMKIVETTADDTPASAVRIFDTHAHYDDEQFDDDREELLASLPDQGVGAVVNVGANLSGSAASISLAERFPHVYAAVGVHPDEVGGLTGEGMEWLRQAASHEKVVAIGEIGLDYYWDKENREVQKRWFREQLRLAKEMHLPVIIHSREAAADTWEVMKSEHLEDMTGVIHCFSYSKEMAENYLKSGFYLGIGGVITFKNAKKLVEVVECAPLSQLLLETDCPYLAPVPYRGKRNSSLYLPYMAERIAEIKGVTPEEVIRVTWENACRMYGVPASPGAVAAETDTAETDRAILPGNPADDSIMYGVNAKDNAQDARRKGD